MKPFVFYLPATLPISQIASDYVFFSTPRNEFCCGQFAQKDIAYCMHTTTYAATNNNITLSNELPRASKCAMQK